jgi:hypothetical protein
MKTLGGGWLINSKHTHPAEGAVGLVRGVAAILASAGATAASILLSLREATGCNSIYARGRGIPHCYGVKSPPSGHESHRPFL